MEISSFVLGHDNFKLSGATNALDDWTLSILGADQTRMAAPSAKTQHKQDQ